MFLVAYLFAFKASISISSSNKLYLDKSPSPSDSDSDDSFLLLLGDDSLLFSRRFSYLSSSDLERLFDLRDIFLLGELLLELEELVCVLLVLLSDSVLLLDDDRSRSRRFFRFKSLSLDVFLRVNFFFRPNSSYSSESDDFLCLYSTFSLSLNPPPSPLRDTK